MNNVVDFSAFKKNKPASNPNQDIDIHLTEMKQQLFGDTRSTKEIDKLFSEAKKQLRTRGVKKIRITHQDLPELKKSRTIILETDKLAFSESILKDDILDSGWRLISLTVNNLSEAINLVSIVLKTLEENNNAKE